MIFQVTKQQCTFDSLKKKEVQWSSLGWQQLAAHHEHCMFRFLGWKGSGEIAGKVL